MGLKAMERLECIKVFTEVTSQLLTIYIYFVLNSAQSSGKKKRKTGSEEIFKRKLVYFVLHYSRSRFFRKVYPELRDRKKKLPLYF